MVLTNYRDVSQRGSDTGAGFQFEFQCANCARTWKSPFKPYRRGQIAGLVYKLAYYLGDRGSMFRATNAVANAGAKGARESALQDAIELAEERYAECRSCHRVVCLECWDARATACVQCSGVSSAAGTDSTAAAIGASEARMAEGRGAPACPNCGAEIVGGRFCAECGFDMASTHKTCPGCGAMCTRTARFCPDCGHGF